MLRVQEICAEHGIDLEDAMELLWEFVRYTEEETLVTMRAGLSTQDVVKVQKAAHSLKGAALNLKLDETASVAREVEVVASDNLDKASELVDRLEEQVRLLRSLLHQYSS